MSCQDLSIEINQQDNMPRVHQTYADTCQTNALLLSHIHRDKLRTSSFITLQNQEKVT